MGAVEAHLLAMEAALVALVEQAQSNPLLGMTVVLVVEAALGDILGLAVPVQMEQLLLLRRPAGQMDLAAVAEGALAGQVVTPGMAGA